MLDKLNVASDIARKAGDIIMQYINIDKEIQYKSNINLVTRADQESEEYVCNALQKEYPEDGILAEEGFRVESKSGDTWVVDPLDGTTSFSHGFPCFAVSIALVDKENQPVLAVVYNPFYNELYSAIKGSGATLNNKKIQVSDIKVMEKSLIGTGFPYTRKTEMELILQRLSRILYTVHDIRRTGAASLDLCYVACGRLEGYYETGLQPWDVAAGLLIVEEAGGRSSLFNGDSIDIHIPQTLASNGLIHNEFRNIVLGEEKQ